MSVIWLLLLLCVLEPVHGVCIDVNDSVHTRQGYSDLIPLSQTPMSAITLQFTILFPPFTMGDPVMYVFGTEGENPPPNPRLCFLPANKLIPNKHYIPLSEKYQTGRCSRQANDTLLCTETVVFGYLKPRYWFVRFGYACGEENHLLSLKYNLCTNDYEPDGCKQVTFDDTCNKHRDNGLIYFPNRFGHKDQVEALENQRYFDVYTTLSDQNRCYKFTSTFICMSLYPACNETLISKSTNNASIAIGTTHRTTFTVPCKKMCKDLIQGCQSVLEIDGIIECEKYPSDVKTCLYLEVTCPQLNDTIDNGVVATNASEAHNNRTIPKLNDIVTYTCDDGFIVDGPATLTCLPSGQWNNPIPQCKQNSHQYLAVIISSVVIFAILVLSAAILFYYRKRLAYFKNKVRDSNMYPLQAMDRKVFVSFSSEDRPFVDAFLEELKTKITFCEYITYHDHFLPGEQIIEHIRKAVWVESYAVINYVTQDFIDSDWCREEFRQVLRRQEQEEGFQVVNIVKEKDTVPQLVNIPRDIKSYLTDHIYLCLDEPLFWDRLRRAISEQI